MTDILDTVHRLKLRNSDVSDAESAFVFRWGGERKECALSGLLERESLISGFGNLFCDNLKTSSTDVAPVTKS
jgi:hypothetical protein